MNKGAEVGVGPEESRKEQKVLSTDMAGVQEAVNTCSCKSQFLFIIILCLWG